jgi:hypothetical protein
VCVQHPPGAIPEPRYPILAPLAAQDHDPARWERVHDVLLLYAKSETCTWNNVHLPYEEDCKARFGRTDPDGRKWTDHNLTEKGLAGGGYTYEYKGATSHYPTV